MPPLRNPHHERVAQLRAAGKKHLEAVRAAGYDNMTAANARKLGNRPDVRARVEELRPQIDPADITNLDYIATKVRHLAEQIRKSAGDHGEARRIADDLRRLASALDQQTELADAVAA